MNEQQPEVLRLAIGLSHKINLGNYESAELSLHISGLTESTTSEEIDRLLTNGKLGYEALRTELAQKVMAAKPAGGWR